ncbi:MAG: alpha/beta hydrolase [Deltaproteobacteria bacterium]|nr:alpha/beta hydrolase [Deltaproteobacteria bacterium]
MRAPRRGRTGAVGLGLTLGLVALVYGLGGVALTVEQEALVFPAPKVDRATLHARALAAGAEEVALVAADGTHLYAWHRAAAFTPPAGPRAVLLFHGNAETVYTRQPVQDALVAAGWEVFVVAYRGYPGSEGESGEAGIRLDGLAAWDWLSARVPRDRIAIHGKSLGGGVAALIAEEVQPRALVLESTFQSVPAAGRDYAPIYPTDLMMRVRFDTRERAPRITCPVLVVHGTKDHTIRVRHGRALPRFFPHATYVEVEGGDHNTNFTLSDPVAAAAWWALLEEAAPAGEPSAPVGQTPAVEPSAPVGQTPAVEPSPPAVEPG